LTNKVPLLNVPFIIITFYVFFFEWSVYIHTQNFYDIRLAIFLDKLLFIIFGEWQATDDLIGHLSKMECFKLVWLVNTNNSESRFDHQDKHCHKVNYVNNYFNRQPISYSASDIEDVNAFF
jgi:hypothetical protein